MNQFRYLFSLLVLIVLAGCAGGEAEPSVEPVAEGAAIEADVVPVTAEALLAEMRAADAEIVVVNFWATWCLPCREEFPDLVRFSKEYDPGRVAVRFVSADFEEDFPAAVAYLEEQGAPGPAYVQDGKEGRFIDTLNPDWSGSLPATFVFDGDGNRLDFWEGKTTYDDLARRVDQARRSGPSSTL